MKHNWIISIFIAASLFLNGDSKANDLNGFIYNVPWSNQPNCVVGAFCMFANERLNVKHSPTFWQTNKLTMLNQHGVNIDDIPKAWNTIFPSNHLNCAYNTLTRQIPNMVVNYEEPYLWIGVFTNGTKVGIHACLIYMHPTSVSFKQFVYNIYTHTNDMYHINYPQFFNDTIQIYSVSK